MTGAGLMYTMQDGTQISYASVWICPPRLQCRFPEFYLLMPKQMRVLCVRDNLQDMALRMSGDPGRNDRSRDRNTVRNSEN